MSYSSVNGLFAAAGRPVKNPEGPITLKRFPIAGGGKCLLIYYYNSPGHTCPGDNWSQRNPYWLSAGWEEGAEVRLSQPEVVLYDLNMIGGGTAAGYPDFIESGSGSVWVTETNKTHARLHRYACKTVCSDFVS